MSDDITPAEEFDHPLEGFDNERPSVGLDKLPVVGLGGSAGLTVVHDPDETERSGMPRAAMATGLVDWVLPASQISARVLDYFRVEREMRLPSEQGAAPTELARGPVDPDETALRDVRRVLSINDNAEALWSLAKVLRAAGHQVEIADSGEQCLTMARWWEPDVVILDVGLPDISGLEVARRIRAESWGERTLLIAATGWGASQDQQDSASAGFDVQLVKPIKLTERRRLLAEHAQHA